MAYFFLIFAALIFADMEKSAKLYATKINVAGIKVALSNHSRVNSVLRFSGNIGLDFSLCSTFYSIE